MAFSDQYNNKQDFVSVIIPCYNHGNFIACAIESVLAQDHKAFEIIVVDDGSTDNSKEEAYKFPSIKYIHQSNQGLSAARNTGIEHSSGNYLVFLDADDWLLPKALSTNINFLKQNSEAAFVSGAHEVVKEEENKTKTISETVSENHYRHLLKGNYIGMHATVMYRRFIFHEFRFDRMLKACEDYDLYLRIARKYPVLHHTEKIAAYRIHSANMSGNIAMMLNKTLAVLKKQKQFLKSREEEDSLKEGLKIWRNYYCKKAYENLLRNHDQKLEYLLIKNDKNLYLKYLTYKPRKVLKKRIKSMAPAIKNSLPDFVSRRLRDEGLFKSYTPAIGHVNMGDLNRTKPFSKEFGYDRGGPVDRYYIENFLLQNATAIAGRVLEIGDNEYTLSFGGSKVLKSDILHIDASNQKATFIGDLSNAPQLPGNTFDCVILTQTLHLIYDFNGAINTCYRILKPGGTLLLTVPGISQIDEGEWGESWLWSFTKASISKILNAVFPLPNIEVNTHGNVMVAAAFLYGMGLPEIDKKILNENDPHYQLIITAKATKPEQ